MEALRFDLQSRGIVSFTIDAAVVDWELRVFLELLGMPPDQLPSLFGAPVYLRSRGVIGITVGVPDIVRRVRLHQFTGANIRRRGNANPDSTLPPLDSLEAFADLMVASSKIS